MVEERIGPYRILEKIAETGQALSYKAIHEHLNRYVFLKVLPGTVHSSEERRNRFLQEARALARVDHPSVVRVYDAGEFHGKLYLASEFLSGPDMHTLITESGALPWERTKEIARTLLEGLLAIHKAGIVHRDIKPSNIVLGEHGPKLADFGLARLADNPQGTQSDTFVGTPAYIAPEILRGKHATPRSDLFALGGTLFELLTGLRAFKGDTFQAVLARILDHDPLEKTDLELPDEGHRFLQMLLEKDPQRRPKDAGEALALLEGTRSRTGTFRIGRVLVLGLPVIAALIYYLVIVPGRDVQRSQSSDSLPESTLVTHRVPEIDVPETTAMVVPEEDIVDSMESPGDSVKYSDTGDSLPDVSPTVLMDIDLESPTQPPKIAEELLLWVFSTPWAEISLNDSVVDTTPLSEPVVLQPGGHTFTFRHPSYLPITRFVEVIEGGTDSLMVSMPESTSFLRVSAEPWATVEVDGTSKGVTPFAAPIPVRPGYRRITMRNPYHGEHEDSLSIAPAETVVVSIHFGDERVLE